MKTEKFRDLIFLASEAQEIPEKIILNGLSLDKFIYLQDDTLNPVILIFSNFISKKMFNKEIFNVPVFKSDDTLTSSKIGDEGVIERDDEISESIRILVIMESINMIFNLKNKNDCDLTNLVINWRETLADLNENDVIDCSTNVQNLIIKNIKSLSTKYDNKLIN